jgi:1,4-alpha-glucan branching enzyme
MLFCYYAKNEAVCTNLKIFHLLCYNFKNEIVMSIKKQFIKTKPVCKVTFSVEAKEANQVSVIGDFNDWKVEEGALSKLKNGTFKGSFDLNKDSAYEFKYVIDGAYVNEPEADSFKWNDFAGAENSVLVV